MPTYDYECDACGHTQELFQSINDEPLKKCPKCRKQKFRRLFGAGAGILFKGSGFYQTDYRSDAYKKSAAADSKPSDGGGSSDSKPSESKPAAAEAKPKSESKPKSDS